MIDSKDCQKHYIIHIHTLWHYAAPEELKTKGYGTEREGRDREGEKEKDREREHSSKKNSELEDNTIIKIEYIQCQLPW